MFAYELEEEEGHYLTPGSNDDDLGMASLKSMAPPWAPAPHAPGTDRRPIFMGRLVGFEEAMSLVVVESFFQCVPT
jgi:hypothetical protein